MAEIYEKTSPEEIEEEREQEDGGKRPYYFQLDVLKAVAIAFVVMDHSLTWEIKGYLGSLFWERLSIPFFLIVMGFNMAYSFKYTASPDLKDLYTKEYFKRKIVRYVFPFLILYMASILIGLYFGYLDTSVFLLLLYLPFWGPGNWFIFLLFSSILVFPLVYWSFTKYPKITIILCFLSELSLQLLMHFVFPLPFESQLEGFLVSIIRQIVLFFLPAIGLGLWFSKGYNLFDKRNWFMGIYVPISLIFMTDYTTHFFSSIPGIVGDSFSLIDVIFRGDYTLLFYGYAALLFLAAMMSIPQKATSSVQRFVQRVGRASYHILLFQIFWMSLVYWAASHEAVYYHEIPNFAIEFGFPNVLYYIPFYLLNLTVSFTGGILWYEAEKRVGLKGKPWYKHVWTKRVVCLFGSVMSMIVMMASIEIVSFLTGLTQWGINQPYFILNDVTGPGVMINIMIIIFFIGLCMAFIYKAFTIDDDEIPI
ncbi:MAG: acyltransferase family protein [Candidatus Thorarchaeota archaeon]|nr:acyltransferase family protein [Candidatus Thorarchaeota archaeon]